MTIPFESVGAAVGVDVRTGVETIETKAPRTSLFLLSVILILTWIGVLVEVTGLGLNCTDSTTSRSPATSELTGTELPPPPPPPDEVTVAVGSDRPVVSPSAFLASTLTLIRLPTSAEATV